MNEVILQAKANVDTGELDAAIIKAHRLKEILEEAKSLADDLASVRINVSLDVDI